MEQLGVEPIQLITQIFNFAIMVFLLTKFLYKPILRALEDRKKKIAEGLAYTQKMQEEMEKTEKKKEEILNKAKDEARKIVEEGKAAGKQLEAEIIKKAHAEAGAILSKGREELVMEKEQMERELRIQTVEIAKGWVEAVLGKILSGKAQQTVVNKKIAELAKSVK